MQVGGIDVRVTRKGIKNLHIAVHPPDGQVRVAAPDRMTDDNIRLAVVNKLRWIRKQQATFAAQVRQSQREMVTGESHYVFGRRYRLEVVEQWGKHSVQIKNNEWLLLTINPNTTRVNREKVLTEWYRAELKRRVPPLLEKWQPRVGREVSGWRVRRMKLHWGSCNIEARRILLNLELAKKTPTCLEYILVHELVHLLERKHNDQFRAHMDRLMPQWAHHRKTLNSSPLAHEGWGY
ncbi:MAG: M48 family metallopeptidase [Candidatus Promineifilaceae bacterium]